MEAFSLIINSIPHDLVIVGRKEGFITVDKKVDSIARAIEDRVHFTGFVSDELLKQYYVHASALVLPSLYEGFGLPPLEAMACGCPTAVSNVASIPEVCGKASLYFNPYDIREIAKKIHLILTDTNLRKTLKEKGYSQAKKFTCEVSAKGVKMLIENIIENR